LFKGPSLAYYRNYKFENEPWWPKFEKLRVKFGITVVKGDTPKRSKPPGVKAGPRSTTVNASSGANGPPKPPVKQRKPRPPEPSYPKYTAMYAYSASEPNELSFVEGDIMFIIQQGLFISILIKYR
jgi:hypothetical protein